MGNNFAGSHLAAVLRVYIFVVARERSSYLLFLLVGFAALLVGTRLSVYTPSFLSPSGGGTDLITSLLVWLPLLLVVLYGFRRSLRDVAIYCSWFGCSLGVINLLPPSLG